LGSKPTRELLDELKPKYWFSAHLHCKFAAIVNHTSDDNVIIFDVFLKNQLYNITNSHYLETIVCFNDRTLIECKLINLCIKCLIKERFNISKCIIICFIVYFCI